MAVVQTMSSLENLMSYTGFLMSEAYYGKKSWILFDTDHRMTSTYITGIMQSLKPPWSERCTHRNPKQNQVYKPQK